jgi:hypothetical protein
LVFCFSGKNKKPRLTPWTWEKQKTKVDPLDLENRRKNKKPRLTPWIVSVGPVEHQPAEVEEAKVEPLKPAKAKPTAGSH